jgi:protein gp37
MGETTAINWCHSTFNPWVGCVQIDQACLNCYAAAIDKRTGGAHWGKTAPRQVTSEKYWRQPILWNRAAVQAGERRRVFCGSMCDWADKDAPKGVVAQVFDLIRKTPQLDWLMLSKRADRIASLLPKDWGDGFPNVWLGVTVGNVKGLWRADTLREIPAVVRFLSVEPLLEDLKRPDFRGIDWVIAGGESGGRCRPMDPAWARAVRDSTHLAGGAFWMKQLGGFPNARHQLFELPPDLRVRELPKARGARRGQGSLFK